MLMTDGHHEASLAHHRVARRGGPRMVKGSCLEENRRKMMENVQDPSRFLDR